MSPVEVEIIKNKIARIIENLKALEPIQKMKADKYKKDLYMRKATERLLQELIEAAIDINLHLITQTGHPAPNDYYETFIKAGELKIIPSDLAEKLAPSSGLRNRLVHEYDRIEHSIILKAVAMSEGLYPLFIKAINDYLAKVEKLEDQS